MDLQKKYHRVKLLGKGSFGRAILVRDAEGRNFVMKEIPLQDMSPVEKKKAAQEAKVLRLLRHPNIVRYHDSFMDTDTLYIVMGYADAGDLEQALQVSPHASSSPLHQLNAVHAQSLTQRNVQQRMTMCNRHGKDV